MTFRFIIKYIELWNYCISTGAFCKAYTVEHVCNPIFLTETDQGIVKR